MSTKSIVKSYLGKVSQQKCKNSNEKIVITLAIAMAQNLMSVGLGELGEREIKLRFKKSIALPFEKMLGKRGARFSNPRAGEIGEAIRYYFFVTAVHRDVKAITKKSWRLIISCVQSNVKCFPSENGHAAFAEDTWCR